jgi:hypothetical protein
VYADCRRAAQSQMIVPGFLNSPILAFFSSLYCIFAFALKKGGKEYFGANPIPRLRGGEPPGGDGHLNPHHGGEHEHQHPLRGVPLDGRHPGEDKHGILEVAYTVIKTWCFPSGIPLARAECAGPNYQSDGKLTFFRHPGCWVCLSWWIFLTM